MPEEMVADYDIRSPASRTLLTVIGTLTTFAVLAGLVLGTSLLMRNTRVATSVVDLGDSAQLVVSATTADIRVVEGEDDVVKVTSRITSGLRKTDFQLGRRGDEIKVVSGCQTWLSPGCGVSLTLEVPKGFPVVIETTSGDVTAAAISEGVLTVSSASGDISGTTLAVDEFSAESSSGDVFATFAKQPFAFKAVTGDGDITASIPDGKRTYAVTAKSISGHVSSQIDSDQDGAGFIRATSDSGDINLRMQ
jgi:hypothetical protein